MAIVMKCYLALLSIGLLFVSTLAREQDAASIRQDPTVEDSRIEFCRTGDIRIAPGGQLIETELLDGRKAIADNQVTKLWPNRTINYKYHNIKDWAKNEIESAIKHWEENTCVNFRQVATHDRSSVFVRFTSEFEGCYSMCIGLNASLKSGESQDMNLGPGCTGGTAIHEIGHVIGFYHEQARSDRDEFIKVLWDNIAISEENQFSTRNDNNYSIPYDLTSIMQYYQLAFSKNEIARTIVSIDPANQRFLKKHATKLSFRDRHLANKMYNCIEGCEEGLCENGGYDRFTVASGKGNCSCDCPPNTSGEFCEHLIRKEYYEPLPCGGDVLKPGIIQTPDYPFRKAGGQSCMWNITAPLGHHVEIHFADSKFAERTRSRCLDESVEIRLNKTGDAYEGDIYCGLELNKFNSENKLKSRGRSAIIIILADDRKRGKGLKATIEFVKDEASKNSGQVLDKKYNEIEDSTKKSLLRYNLRPSKVYSIQL